MQEQPGSRILVIGTSASGKTHFSGRLAEKLGLPLFNLDSIFWKDNWNEEDPEVVAQKIHNLINKNEWVIEGYIEPLATQQLQRATEVIYLDLWGPATLWNGIKRWWKHKRISRPELPENNTDNFSFSFMLTLLKRDERKEIEEVLRDYDGQLTRLKNKKQVGEFLNKL